MGPYGPWVHRAHGSHGPPLCSLGTQDLLLVREEEDQTRPNQTQQDLRLTLFWPERASYKSCEALDTVIRKLVTRSSVLEWSQRILDDSRVLYKGSKVGFYIIGPCFVMNGHPIARMELSIGRIETIA